VGDHIRAEKSRIRAEVAEALAAMTADARARQSAAITKRLVASDAFCAAQCVLGYVALATEVDTAALLHAVLVQGKTLALPRTNASTRTLSAHHVCHIDRDLEPGPFQTQQPRMTCAVIGLDAIDLIVVPGLAFDSVGRRIGHGQGYYDRLLQQVPAQTPRLGLAFACQMRDTLPEDVHDARMTSVAVG
jgi:5-formyltetrahydrofolate cyclo-ligase